MSYRTERRRRQISAKGRQMVLKTATGETSVTVQGYAPPAQVADIADAAAKTAFVCQITNDELAASSYGAPAPLDKLKDGPKSYTLTDATPVYDGPTLCGWTLIAAGGETS
ncbi:hypothetical protein [Acetobacter senegalensis]|uniref:hypothetical protein n=1 Tax=Acetobacter senegalensis TaxID=446692 RepID=UPI00264B7D14|nr:hypothetical protein [Acetobacter senegalensis]MDN7354341.1 hypothetical protein [Acetobacter senegalensis]